LAIKNFKKQQEFDKWKLEKRINGGGNGEVWKVSKDNEIFAIKLLKKLTKTSYERFKDEIKIIEQLQGTNGILPIIDYNLPDYHQKEQAWYVMPIAKDLRTEVKAYSAEVKINVVISIAKVLKELHEKDITHRDIKPGNILIYNNEICLADFGLVDYPDKADLTKRQESVGPKWTMDPEMKRNPTIADSKSADVYSLAKTLWILVTNESLGFEGEYSNKSRVALKNYDGALYTGGLDDILQKATNHDVNARPSMEQFLNELEKWSEESADFEKRNKEEWKLIQKELFPNTLPSRVIWEDINDIVKILNVIGSIDALNHMFIPGGGGMDLLNAKLASEEGCIELNTGLVDVVKPIRLIFESFSLDYQWNYFRLEIDELEPFEANEREEYSLNYEFIVEDNSGNYRVKKRENEVGRELHRYYKPGAFVLFQKTSIYNKNPSTYDGRHSKVSTEEFREYIKKQALRLSK